jgi:hypothetical protein
MLGSTQTDWQKHMLEHMKFKDPANATYVEQVQIGQLSDTAMTKSLCLR